MVAAEPNNQSTQHPYRCMLPDGSLVGGSYDNISAVTIACAYFNVVQTMAPDTTGGHIVTVLDDTDTPIAVIGRNPPDAQ